MILEFSWRDEKLFKLFIMQKLIYCSKNVQIWRNNLWEIPSHYLKKYVWTREQWNSLILKSLNYSRPSQEAFLYFLTDHVNRLVFLNSIIFLSLLLKECHEDLRISLSPSMERSDRPKFRPSSKLSPIKCEITRTRQIWTFTKTDFQSLQSCISDAITHKKLQKWVILKRSSKLEGFASFRLQLNVSHLVDFMASNWDVIKLSSTINHHLRARKKLRF